MAAATAALIVGGVVAATGATQAGMAAHKANKEKKRANKKKKKYAAQLAEIENNRLEVVNPYEDVTNPFANLGVATQAAEFQAEQADIALANTLDTIRATGAGAGGATALAQAALQSKRGISASIEQQEAKNAQLSASGEASRQQSEAAGKQFVFQTKDNREMMKMNRLAGLEQQFQSAQMYYDGQRTQAMGDVVGAVGDGLTTGISTYTSAGGDFGG